MKILIRLCFVLFFGTQLYGQNSYLNERYKRNVNSINPSLALGDSCYYLASDKHNNSKLYHYTKINHQGLIVDSLNFIFNDTLTGIENCKGCLQVHKGVLYNMYTNFPNNSGNDTAAIVLSKIHLNLKDTVESKVFTIEGYKAVAAESSFFDSDTTFLITGYAARYVGANLNYKYDLLLAKFDTSFNLIWATTVSENTPINVGFGPIGANIIVDDYGGILVSGNPYVEPLPKIGFAARFDAKTGDSLWYKEFKGDYGIGGMYTAKRDDGNYQFIQNQIDQTDIFYLN